MTERHEDFSTSLSAIETTWVEVVEHTRRLATLPLNWDGEGAERVARSLIESAVCYFRHLSESPSPHRVPDAVYPHALGHIIAEWHDADGTRITVSFRKPGQADIMLWQPDGRPPKFLGVSFPEGEKSLSTGPLGAQEESGGSIVFALAL